MTEGIVVDKYVSEVESGIEVTGDGSTLAAVLPANWEDLIERHTVNTFKDPQFWGEHHELATEVSLFTL